MISFTKNIWSWITKNIWPLCELSFFIIIFCSVFHKNLWFFLKGIGPYLIYFSLAVFLSIEGDLHLNNSWRRFINYCCKVFAMSICIYEILLLLFFKAIEIDYPKNYKNIIYLTPVSSFNFMNATLIFVGLLSVVIFFTSNEANIYIHNIKFFVFPSILEFLVLIYAIITVILTLLISLNYISIQKNLIIHYIDNIVSWDSFLISVISIRLFSKNNPLYLLIHNKYNYVLIWPLLSFFLTLIGLFIR